jgi:spermidine synthase
MTALDRPNRRVAVIGLGTGTMAAWGRPGDTFRFYEINPAVEAIARTWFSYLKDSKAQVEVVLGDARVQLERELASGTAQPFDAIVVDAFSGDAIPMHLLTAECGEIYRRRLVPGGLLLLHISNQALNLEPVARGLAQYLGWDAAQDISSGREQTGESRAQWVIITSDRDFLKRPEISRETSAWGLAAAHPILWTDDFASLWHVLD